MIYLYNKKKTEKIKVKSINLKRKKNFPYIKNKVCGESNVQFFLLARTINQSISSENRNEFYMYTYRKRKKERKGLK